ncbi:hypothetical protein ACQ4PT_026794 [Festuca glaucescens]
MVFRSGDDARGEGGGAAEPKRPRSCGGATDAKVLNKKQIYGQFHLELGQPDFLLHMCAVCGLMYARGNDEDEKVHRAYHKSYFQGVPFKKRSNKVNKICCSTRPPKILMVCICQSLIQNYGDVLLLVVMLLAVMHPVR